RRRGTRRRSGPARTGPWRPRVRGAEAVRASMAGAAIGTARLHPEDAEPGLRDRGVERSLDAEREHPAGVERVDHTVVPEPRGGEPGRALALVRFQDRRLERVPRGIAVERAADRREDSRRLLAAHHRDATVRPGPEEAGPVRPPGHRVVPRAEA